MQEAALRIDRPTTCSEPWRERISAGRSATSSGTTALRDGLIQRLFRDVNAGTAHITSGPQTLQKCGRELAGLAPDQSWMLFALEA